MIFGSWNLAVAQHASGSFGGAFVPSEGFLSIFGDHSFEFAECARFPGLIVTARDEAGFVNFTREASWSGASDISHVDGFVRTFSEGPFVFPIGNDGRLRLLGITGSRNASASYTSQDPATITGELNLSNTDLDAVSTREFWELRSENETAVTLTWGQFSNIEDLVSGDINKLTLIGWTPTGWEVIPSQVNEFTLLSNSFNELDEEISSSFVIGSISSIDPFVPDDFMILSLGSLTEANAGIVGDGEINVFPNPAKIGSPTYISYDLLGKRGKLEIYDGFNRLVFSQRLDQESGRVLFPNHNLVDDRYVITLIEANGRKTSKQLILIR
jgi:hypothetical protein